MNIAQELARNAVLAPTSDLHCQGSVQNHSARPEESKHKIPPETMLKPGFLGLSLRDSESMVFPSSILALCRIAFTKYSFRLHHLSSLTDVKKQIFHAS